MQQRWATTWVIALIGSGDVAWQELRGRGGIRASVGLGEEVMGQDTLCSSYQMAKLEPQSFLLPGAHHTSASGPLLRTAGLLRSLAVAIATFTYMVHSAFQEL